MKASWQTKTLKDTCVFLNGLWKGKIPPFVQVGVIRNTNFTKEGTLDDSDIAYLPVERKQFEKRRLQSGDIILEKSGGGPKQPVGRVILYDKREGDFSFSNFTSAIRVRNPTELDYRFLHRYLWWVHSSGVTEKMQSHSTGIRNLDGDAYKSIRITFPPLPEQHRIVAILDEAFAGIATATANAERNLNNAREVFKAKLKSTFSDDTNGWELKSLSEVSSFEGGSQPPKTEFIHQNKPSYVRFLQIRDFASDKNVTYIPESKKNRLCSADDILIGRYGASVGKILTGKAGAYNVAMMKAIPDLVQLKRSWFFYYLISDEFQARLANTSSRSAQDGFSKDDIANFPVPLPTISEQNRIIAKIEALSAETQRLQDIYQQKVSVLNELKQSILHQAFSGQLH